MLISVRYYLENDEYNWDKFVAQSYQGTFLHTRKYLNYHGNKFTDQSLMLEVNGELVGVFPAAENPTQEKNIISHPGITYGGILTSRVLTGSNLLEAFKCIINFYCLQNYAKILFKLTPSFYRKVPSQDDSYCLFRLGALRQRCDLSSTIDLTSRLQIGSRRKRNQKKAIKNEISVDAIFDFDNLLKFWSILENNLRSKYNTEPVHSIEEIKLLIKLFPNNIKLVVGKKNSKILGGTILYITDTTYHTQYIAASDNGVAACVLDVVLEECISLASLERKRWFDFGISNEEQGSVLNDGLYKFKSEFGGSGAIHEFYEVSTN
jgi:hypothetical protein